MKILPVKDEIVGDYAERVYKAMARTEAVTK